MIQSVSTPELQTEFLRRIAHKPYFESTLGTHLHLFGNHPASGWAFYLLPGSAVLELRGGSAVLCGALRGGEAGEDAREELTGFLRFLHADTLRTEHPLTLPGWQPAVPCRCRPRPRRSLSRTKRRRCCRSAALSLPRATPRPTSSTPRPARRWPTGWAPAARCCTTADPSARWAATSRAIPRATWPRA